MSTSAFVVLWTFASGPAEAASPPEVSCEGCVVASEGRILWGRDARVPLPNASTTKIVTALVVLREAELEERVEVSENAAATPAGLFELHAGEEFEVGELLEALLMASSNDAAVALAEHVSGTEGAFVSEMNALAADLGATDSNFETAHGLDVTGHETSPLDLVVLAEALLAEPELARIVGSAEATVEGSPGATTIANTNPLLETYPGATGVKTGMTAAAGDVLVAAARRDGAVVIAVALGSVDAAADATELLDYGFERLERRAARSRVLVREGEIVGEAVLDPGGTAPVVAVTTIRGSLDGGLQKHVRLDHLLEDPAAGERVGTVTLVSEGEIVGRAPLTLADPPEEDSSLMVSLIEMVLRAVYAVGRSVGAF